MVHFFIIWSSDNWITYVTVDNPGSLRYWLPWIMDHDHYENHPPQWWCCWPGWWWWPPTPASSWGCTAERLKGKPGSTFSTKKISSTIFLRPNFCWWQLPHVTNRICRLWNNFHLKSIYLGWKSQFFQIVNISVKLPAPSKSVQNFGNFKPALPIIIICLQRSFIVHFASPLVKTAHLFPNLHLGDEKPFYVTREIWVHLWTIVAQSDFASEIQIFSPSIFFKYLEILNL